MPTRRALLILFVVALAARVVIAFAFGISLSARGDERGYSLLAGTLVADGVLELPVSELVLARSGLDPEAVAPRTAFRAPMLPLVMAPVAAAGGGLTAMRVVNMLLGALAAPLLFLALRDGPLGRHRFWAALVYTGWPPLVYLSVRVLSEPLSQVLLLGAVIALVPRDDASPRPPLVAGALAGLAILTRPAALFSAAFLAFAAGSRKRGILFLAAFAVVLAPWLVRNTLLHGRPLMTTNSGVTLVGGNSPVAAAANPPGKWIPPEVIYAGSPQPPDLVMWGWSDLSEAQSDSRFTRDAITWAKEQPGDALRLVGFKLVRLFDPDPRSTKPDWHIRSVIGWLTLTPVLLLCLAGAGTVWRERRAHAAWLALLAGTILVATLFYGDTRMRTAADPALLTFATVGALAVVRRLRPGARPAE